MTSLAEKVLITFASILAVTVQKQWSDQNVWSSPPKGVYKSVSSHCIPEHPDGKWNYSRKMYYQEIYV